MYNSNPYIFIPFYLIKSINGKVVILPTPIQKHITINRFISPYLKYFVFRIISMNCYSELIIALNFIQLQILRDGIYKICFHYYFVN